jgi:hypothetical protein
MPTSIDRHQVQHLVAEGARLVDVLPRDEHAESHLPGALNLPVATYRPDVLIDALREVVHARRARDMLITDSDGTLVGLVMGESSSDGGRGSVQAAANPGTVAGRLALGGPGASAPGGARRVRPPRSGSARC